MSSARLVSCSHSQGSRRALSCGEQTYTWLSGCPEGRLVGGAASVFIHSSLVPLWLWVDKGGCHSDAIRIFLWEQRSLKSCGLRRRPFLMVEAVGMGSEGEVPRPLT